MIPHDITKQIFNSPAFVYTNYNRDGSNMRSPGTEMQIVGDQIEIDGILDGVAYADSGINSCYAVYNIKTEILFIRYYKDSEDDDGKYESVSYVTRTKLYKTEEEFFQASTIEDNGITFDQNLQALNFILNVIENFVQPFISVLEKYK